MFAKHKQGAACLEDYGDIKKGAIVPMINELWAQVEEWLASNGGAWEELPANFGKTYALEIDELNSWRAEKEKDFSEKVISVLARNGATQEAALAAMRAAILVPVDEEYASRKSEIRSRYYGS